MSKVTRTYRVPDGCGGWRQVTTDVDTWRRLPHVTVSRVFGYACGGAGVLVGGGGAIAWGLGWAPHGGWQAWVPGAGGLGGQSGGAGGGSNDIGGPRYGNGGGGDIGGVPLTGSVVVPVTAPSPVSIPEPMAALYLVGSIFLLALLRIRR